MKNEHFYHLTPDLILSAMEDLGLDTNGHCFALNSMENRVYSIGLENGSNIVAKFYRPGRWDRREILEEHHFLLELQENEIPVCAPIQIDGKTVFEKEGLFYAVWERVGGRLPEELSHEDLVMLGHCLARIHNVGETKLPSHRVRLSSARLIGESLSIIGSSHLITPSQFKEYELLAKEIGHIYDEKSKDVPFLRIHGDCHKSNILRGENGFFFLDFDDFAIGPAVQDIWMLLPYQDRTGIAAREYFLEGYQEFRDFDRSWFSLIEVLRAMRYIYYSAWITRRWEDPSFPNAFPHFGSNEYWEKETSELRHQIKLFNKEYLDEEIISNSEEEPELTNKDFFWDME